MFHLFLGFLLFWIAYHIIHLPEALAEHQPPEAADCIVVLAGDGGLRVEQGVALLKQGYAAKILLSGGPIYQDTTMASLMRNHVISLGISEDQTLTQNKSRTTAEDAYYSIQLLREYHFQKVIVVTSPWHSKRAITWFRKLAPDIQFISCPSEPEWNKNWWDNPEVVRAIVAELLKMFWRESLPK